MASAAAICMFCTENILRSTSSWAFHHPSQSSLASSAHRNCTFCSLLHEDVQSHRKALHRFEVKNADLKRWLHEDVAKSDVLLFGHGGPTSLYRWSSRTLGRTREDKHTLAITFRVVPKFPQDSQNTLSNLQTFGLPERVFYCFREAELGHLSSAARIGKSTDPSANGGQQIKDWIRTCGIGHKHCPKRAGSASKFVPTRLLHIGGKRPGDRIRIVNTKLNSVKGHYVTLSHCWGKLPLVTLCSETLEEFMLIGVPWCQLSSNFQQAIEVSWFLEVDYIWIDSLCIIQRDKEDWKQESSRMEKVYRNSYCNIAAADAGDSTGGLFRQRDPYSVLPTQLEMTSGSLTFGRHKWRVLRADLWEHGLLSMPLYKRGWVYQERMLAPRIIHFSRNQIFWDCTEMSACEAVPSGLPLPLEQQSATDRHWRARLQESAKGTMLLSGSNDESLEDFWKSTVEDYTKLDLTNQSDKRMAIWGVAKRMRDTLEEDYVAGMWRDGLEEQLTWRVADCTTAVRPIDLTVNPTWSWTSVQGAILIAARSKWQSKSYVITSSSGDPISFNLETDDSRPGPNRKHSNNASDMGRELDLVDERRRKSSAASRHHSQAEAGTRTAHTSLVFSPRSMSPNGIESQSMSREQGLLSEQHSLSNLEDKWDKEPQLQDRKIAMQGYLNTGYLKRGRSSNQWSLVFDAISGGGTDVEAFPDVLPANGSTEVVFVILTLTKITQTVGQAVPDHGTCFHGHGLMLRQTTDKSCFNRIGTLQFRCLSDQIWQRLRTVNAKADELEHLPTSTSGSRFYLT